MALWLRTVLAIAFSLAVTAACWKLFLGRVARWVTADGRRTAPLFGLFAANGTLLAATGHDAWAILGAVEAVGFAALAILAWRWGKRA